MNRNGADGAQFGVMRKPPRRFRAIYLVQLCDLLRQQGVDTDAIFAAAGIDPKQFEHCDAQILPEQLDAFGEAAVRLTGRTDLGFEGGRLIKFTSHDVVGLGMLSAPNAHESFRFTVRHYHLLNQGFSMRYVRMPEFGEFTYTPVVAMPTRTLHHIYEVLAIAHRSQFKLFSGLVPYDIYLSMPEPPHVARYAELAPVRFHFEPKGLPGVRVVMRAEDLDRTSPFSNPRMFNDIDQRCRLMGVGPDADEPQWGEYVEMMLRETHGELLTLDQLAERLRISKRTLDRYLKRENINFRELQQRILVERACELLRAPGATVNAVAHYLGFSVAGNFSRAFRRIVGESPREYQARHEVSV